MNTLAEWMVWMESRASRQDACLVWKQSFNGNQPQACIGDRESKKTVNMRRKLYEMRVGRPPRQYFVVICTCGTYGCVEPAHLKEISRSAMLKGKPLTVEHRLAITKAQRRRSKLKQSDVNEIRYGDGTPEEKAARYDITEKYVEDIIAQRCWKDYSSPFAGLGA